MALLSSASTALAPFLSSSGNKMATTSSSTAPLDHTLYLYSTEKPCIVLDFGRRFTKIGLSGESRPRFVLDTPELYYRPWVSERVIATSALDDGGGGGGGDDKVEGDKQRRSTSSSSKARASSSSSASNKSMTPAKPLRAWIKLLEPLLDKIFFQQLKLNPVNKRIILCESPFLPLPFKSAVYYLLFEKFKAGSVVSVCDLLMPLYLTGTSRKEIEFDGGKMPTSADNFLSTTTPNTFLTGSAPAASGTITTSSSSSPFSSKPKPDPPEQIATGIVIDVGHASTRILPVFAGVPLLTALQEIRYGGESVTQQWETMLAKAATELPSLMTNSMTGKTEQAEDYKVKLGFVRYNNFPPPDTSKPVKENSMEEEKLFRELLGEDGRRFLNRTAGTGMSSLTAAAAGADADGTTTSAPTGTTRTPPFVIPSRASSSSSSTRRPYCLKCCRPQEKCFRNYEILTTSSAGRARTMSSDGDNDVKVENFVDSSEDQAEDFESELLVTAFWKAVDLCPLDVKTKVVQNVVLCGGQSGAIGFFPRLAEELQKSVTEAVLERQFAKKMAKKASSKTGRKDSVDNSAKMGTGEQIALSPTSKQPSKKLLNRGLYDIKFARIDTVPPLTRIWTGASLFGSVVAVTSQPNLPSSGIGASAAGGGSRGSGVDGGTNIPGEYTMEQYKNGEPIPDWCVQSCA
ncbi:unnamed protein product [Amoebophrya sp. A120]|nr:unnamed protein product [Amoebophrya sp. A120]|eukprot:GSA120T00006743001.1